MGLHFTAPPSAGGLQWQGRGPHECYWDRKWGAPLRRHRVDTVEELHVPYIVPGNVHTPCQLVAPTPMACICPRDDPRSMHACSIGVGDEVHVCHASCSGQ